MIRVPSKIEIKEISNNCSGINAHIERGIVTEASIYYLTLQGYIANGNSPLKI